MYTELNDVEVRLKEANNPNYRKTYICKKSSIRSRAEIKQWFNVSDKTLNINTQFFIGSELKNVSSVKIPINEGTVNYSSMTVKEYIKNIATSNARTSLEIMERKHLNVRRGQWSREK